MTSLGSVDSSQGIRALTMPAERLLSRPESWVLRAACLDVGDPDLFFPPGEHGRSVPQLEEARKICERCPVREECLALALGCDEQYGMWGGTTPNERQAIRRGPKVRFR